MNKLKYQLKQVLKAIQALFLRLKQVFKGFQESLESPCSKESQSSFWHIFSINLRASYLSQN